MMEPINPEWTRDLKEAAAAMGAALGAHRPDYTLEDVMYPLWAARARLDRAIHHVEAAYFAEENENYSEAEAEGEVERILTGEGRQRKQ